MKQTLVARGVGIATSVTVSNVIEEMAKEHNIKVDTRQIEITEAGPYEDTVGLLIITTMTKKEYRFLAVNAHNSSTGTGIGETKQQISTELQK